GPRGQDPRVDRDLQGAHAGLGDPEGDRLQVVPVEVLGQGVVGDLQQQVVLPEAEPAGHHQYHRRDDDAVAQLIQMLDERQLIVELRRPHTGHGSGSLVGNDLALDGLIGILRALDRRRLRRLFLFVVVSLAGDRSPDLADALAHRAPQLRQALRPEDHEGDDEDDDQLEWSHVWHREGWY